MPLVIVAFVMTAAFIPLKAELLNVSTTFPTLSAAELEIAKPLKYTFALLLFTTTTFADNPAGTLPAVTFRLLTRFSPLAALNPSPVSAIVFVVAMRPSFQVMSSIKFVAL